MINRIIIASLCLIWTGAGWAACTITQLPVSKGGGHPVAVSIGEKAPFSALQFKVIYDPKQLTVQEIKVNKGLDAVARAINAKKPGEIRVAFASDHPMEWPDPVLVVEVQGEGDVKVEQIFVDDRPMISAVKHVN